MSVPLLLYLYLYLYLFLFVIPSAFSQLHKASYEILSQGEEISVPLQDYFDKANKAGIIPNKCSEGFQDFFDASKTLSPTRNLTYQKM